MNGLDVIHIFLRRIARMAHVADHVSGGHHASLLQAFRVRIVLAKVGVIIISFLIKASDADPPAAVFIPSEGLHVAGFHGDDRRADLAHHVMSQMRSGVSIASGSSEIIGIAVREGSRNGRKGLQAVFSPPHHISFLILLLNQELPHHSAKHSLISFLIIIIGRKLLRFLLQHCLSGPKPLRRIFQICKGTASELSAVSGGGTGQQADPVNMAVGVIGSHICLAGKGQGFAGNVEIHPFNIILPAFLRLTGFLTSLLLRFPLHCLRLPLLRPRSRFLPHVRSFSVFLFSDFLRMAGSPLLRLCSGLPDAADGQKTFRQPVSFLPARQCIFSDSSKKKYQKKHRQDQTLPFPTIFHGGSHLFFYPIYEKKRKKRHRARRDAFSLKTA